MTSPVAALLSFVLNAQLVASLPRVPLPKPAASAMKATTHSNVAPAGVRAGGVLTLDLDVVESAWRPEGDEAPEVPILAFAESGKGALVPGPLVRVPMGTEVRLTLHNRSDSALVIGGLRPGLATGVDTVQLAQGQTREVRYRLSAAGSYYYWGAFAGTSRADRNWKDSQLNGAIVVDSPGAAMPDHIMVISEWFLPYEDGKTFEVATVFNGRGWPYTERIDLTQGDSTRFRILNATDLHHPLHLHGFYYRLESNGDGAKDVPIPRSQQHLSNTDLIGEGATYTLSFVPTTPGNWLYHCHFAFHADENASLVGSPKDSAEAVLLAHTGGMPHHSMRGLVIGIRVAPAPGYRAPSTAGARDVRLFVGKSPLRLPANAPAIGFSLQRDDKPPARDSVSLPGPVLELRRGQPVRIIVRNNLDEPTSVHWHGLEIESFPDGVPHWSGLGDRIYSQIAPGDSFVAAFTPPRSGTFPYHSHLNDRRHIQSGMYGAIVITDGPRDTTRDHVIIAGGGGPEVERNIESPYALVNGRQRPRPLHMTVGETHRLRIVSIHPDWRIAFTLRNDSTLARWRAIAKDGADLPRSLATSRPAQVVMGPGETSDFEFTPTAPGTWRMEVRSTEAGWYIPMAVIVAPKKSSKGPR